MARIDLLRYEKTIWSRGVEHIAGVDEAGRGCLAGPLVAAAVILNKRHLRNNDVSVQMSAMYREINDSKLLTPKKRKTLYEFIQQNAISYAIYTIEHSTIDQAGIAQANQMALFSAVKNLQIAPHHVITDHFPIRGYRADLQTNVTNGDKLSISVAAASILAKVYRDELMIEMHEKYTVYGFDQHKGYGTKMHMEALKTHGPCEIHRKSFRPVKDLI